MTTTLDHTPDLGRTVTGLAPGAAPAPAAHARPRWPVFGVAGAMAGFASILVSMPTLTEEEAGQGVDVIDQLDRAGYHAGFVLGLVSVGCLLVASQGWKRWAEDRAPRDLAARTLAHGLAVTATINV
ncbi:MAG TPA: hypothetical protein VHK88_11255, partial [Aquihabitans sp.]|nr:hypothetical protein [Aquihabitans sp.]